MALLETPTDLTQKKECSERPNRVNLFLETQDKVLNVSLLCQHLGHSEWDRHSVNAVDVQRLGVHRFEAAPSSRFFSEVAKLNSQSLVKVKERSGITPFLLSCLFSAGSYVARRRYVAQGGRAPREYKWLRAANAAAPCGRSPARFRRRTMAPFQTTPADAGDSTSEPRAGRNQRRASLLRLQTGQYRV